MTPLREVRTGTDHAGGRHRLDTSPRRGVAGATARDGMGYVSGYDFDYFLSYAHEDNKPVPGADTGEGWVSLFFEVLNYELGTLSGGAICSPWKDGRIPLHTELKDEIVNTAGRAAVLLVLLSPSYANSEWCRKELEAFRASRKNGPTFIIVVERQPVDESALADLPKNLRYSFYDEKAGRYYGHPLPSSVSDPFYEKVRDLSTYVKKALDDLRAAPPIPGKGVSDHDQTVIVPPPCSPPKVEGSVFLAPVGTDLEDEYNSVRKFLKQSGVPVRPERDYPQDPEEFRNAATVDLKDATVFVQLLSGKRGARPDGLERGYPTLLYELARERGSSLGILQWCDPTLKIADVSDADSRALLEMPTVRTQPLLNFQQAILEALKPKPKPDPQPRDRLIVFVNGDDSDQPLAQEVGNILRRFRARVFLRTPIKDPREVTEDLKNKLQTSDGMIVIYGTTSDVWVSSQISLYWTWTGETDRSLPASVFEGPPPGEKPLSFIDDDVKVQDCRNNDPAVLEAEVSKFLDRIRAGLPSKAA